MAVKNILRLILASAAIGGTFNLLFWKQIPGLSILLFVLVYLAGLIMITLAEGQRPRWPSWLLLAPILFFAAFAGARQEPFTVFVCLLMTAVCLLILTMTWLGGNWLKYSLSDYIVRFFLVVAGIVTLGLEKFSKKKQDEPAPDRGDPGRFRKFSRRYLIPVIFGLVLAIPAVIILGIILSNADPIFGSLVEAFWRRLFDLNIAEIVLRVFYIAMAAYFAGGAIIFSMEKTSGENLIGLEKPVIPQVFNWVSSATVIFCIDLLFAFFVYIQFRYFFGGQVNITTSGYTYAEYARKGFNELLIVAFLSLLIFLSLSAITRRAEGGGRRFYSALGVILVLLVGIILVSAYQRLGLYEAAYGFSRIRTYSHVFMVWLGALLAATVILEIMNRLRYFALACLLAALSFGATLSLLNVDGFIARQNLARSEHGKELDIPYLVSLSDDAVPDMHRAYLTAQPGSDLKTHAKAVLACRYRRFLLTPRADDWQSFHISHYAASRVYSQVEGELPVSAANIRGSAPIIVDGETIDCFNPSTAIDWED